MQRHMLRYALAGALIGITASSATAQDIVVTGPGERVVDRTNFGAEVVEYTASLAVNVRDLDLATGAGWQALERRLTNASHVACNVIDQRIAVDLRPDRTECESNAYHGAITRVRRLTKTPAS